MTAEIIQFLPRANPKADRAFWIGGDTAALSDAEAYRAAAKEFNAAHDTAPCEMNTDEPA